MKLYFEDDIMDACEEQGCNEPAVKVWRGRKLCMEHYDNLLEWVDSDDVVIG